VKNRILTLAVIAVVLLAGAQLVGCTRLKAATGGSPGTPATVTMQVVVRGATPGIATQIHAGDVLRVKDTGSDVGTVQSVSTTPTLQAVPTAQGTLVASPVPNQEDIMLTIKGNAKAVNAGYTFDGESILVNQDVKFVTPLVTFTGSVLSIEGAGN
jgi:hypothetical protein